MMPRLQAQERLAAIDVAIFGGDGWSPDTAREMLDNLRAQALGEVEQTKRKKATAEDLAAMGISVRVMPPKSPLNDV